MHRAAPSPLTLALAFVAACTAAPIEVDTDDDGNDVGGTDGGTEIATTTSASGYDDDDGATWGTPTSASITSADDDGAWSTGGHDTEWVDSGGWWDSGDDDGSAGTGVYSPCTGWTEQECAASADANGVSCAFLPAYVLDSSASCSFEPYGEMCVEIQPADEGCNPNSCDETPGRFHVQYDEIVIELGTCTAIVGFDACVPGSPNSACACACVGGLP